MNEQNGLGPGQHQLPQEFTVSSSLVWTPAEAVAGGASLESSAERNLVAELASAATDVPGETENLPAQGGAWTALLLGAWSIVGAILTPWSIFNGVLGILFGLWGLTSRRRTLAMVGLLLSVIGVTLSIVWPRG